MTIKTYTGTDQQTVNGLFYTIANADADFSVITDLEVPNLTANSFSVSATNLKISGGSAGQVLATYANSQTYWTNASSGSGTVTSVATSTANTGAGLGFTLTGGPITTSGTITLTVPTPQQLKSSLSLGNLQINMAADSNLSNVLRSDGSWGPVTSGSGGTVTNVAVATANTSDGNFGLTLTGGPITSTGTLTLNVPSKANLLSSLGLTNATTLPNTTVGGTRFLREDGSWQTVTGGSSLPTQTGNTGKFLQTDGTTTSWASPSGAGTVTSVGASGSVLGFAIKTDQTSNGPITGSGTITLSGPTSNQLSASLGLGDIAQLSKPSDTTKWLRGDGTWANIPSQSTNLPNSIADSGKWLRADGTWSVLPVGNIATVNKDGNASNVLRGDGTFASMVTGVTSVTAGNNISIGGTSTQPVVNCDTFTFAKEKTQLITTPPTSISVDVVGNSIVYVTGIATSVMSINITGYSSNNYRLSSVLNVGETLTSTVFITNGASAQSVSGITIDGSSTGVTTKMLNGADLTGNANSIMGYTISTIRTGAAAYTVLVSKARYA
jgi:hypothetical protein